MKKYKPVPVKQLKTCCSLSILDFTNTKELKPLIEIIGQHRAMDAIQFGVEMQADGYNLFALGPHGVGKRSAIKKILQQYSKQKPAQVYDWCYVLNFSDLAKPAVLKLPANYGPKLRDDMDRLIEDLQLTIPSVFESEEYQLQMQHIAEQYTSKKEKLYKRLEAEAKKNGLQILSTPRGFMVVPIEANDDTQGKLTAKERREQEEAIKLISSKLEELLQTIPQLRKEQADSERNVQHGFAQAVISYCIKELKEKYTEIKLVREYLQAVEEDIVQNLSVFLRNKNSQGTFSFSNEQKGLFERYRINSFVSQKHEKHTPIVYEDNPTLENLIGYVEYRSEMGALVTDYRLIKAGALHKANGGFLILDAHKVLMHPYAWYALKRALFSHEVYIESPTRLAGLLNTSTLEPEPIPIDLKVILTGERLYYYLLCEVDPDFKELFKIGADFSEQIPRNKANIKKYARLIATLLEQKSLRPLNQQAVAAVIDYAGRLAEDAEQLSVHMRSIEDLLRESDFWANKEGKRIVNAGHVKKAIAKKIYWADRVREHYYEEIKRDFLLIDTAGKRVGQVNGLSVMEVGGFKFGSPTRITATTRCGKGSIVNIQKEVELSGSIHSKGVLILEGYLNRRYVRTKPLSLTASLVFEQTYDMVDGDSASVAELCVLLSDLSDLPIKQNLAITGSVNQHGEVQAIGGVNEKIEGFFDVCKQRRLTGKQGVIIPEANVQNLMLKDEVIDAVKQKQFAIYAITTVDQAMELLTGVEAGQLTRAKHFPADTINGKVEQTLIAYAEAESESHDSHPHSESDSNDSELVKK